MASTTSNNTSRLTVEQALELWHNAPLSELGAMAYAKKIEKSGYEVYYNRNIHIEPTNICVFRCKFCSYRRADGEDGAWSYSMQEIEELASRYIDKPITEVHIVGGVDPKRGFEFYENLIRRVQEILPQVTVKAYTAVELHYIISRAGLTVEQGLKRLKEAGMGAIAGGGAEIFEPRVREQICPDKCNAQEWLELHRTAQKMGITTNCTMLYGHIESIEDRFRHLELLRDLQDETHGFSAFIPLKFRTANNELGRNIEETPLIEDLRMVALSRLFLDNFDHIKAYWPMFGLSTTQMALNFGADDIDGTIDDTTKIYSMAGAEDQKPVLTVSGCRELIEKAGFDAVERDTHYKKVVL